MCDVDTGREGGEGDDEFMCVVGGRGGPGNTGWETVPRPIMELNGLAKGFSYTDNARKTEEVFSGGSFDCFPPSCYLHFLSFLSVRLAGGRGGIKRPLPESLPQAPGKALYENTERGTRDCALPLAHAIHTNVSRIRGKRLLCRKQMDYFCSISTVLCSVCFELVAYAARSGGCFIGIGCDG